MKIISEAKYDEATGRRLSYKVGKCVCGECLELDGFTNTCDCGRDYNWNGSELAPREQWCEGTDDHLSDVLRIR